MVIGFRSFTDGFAYVVLQGTQSTHEVIAKERVCLPENQSWSESLSWVRKQLAEVLRRYDVDAACIKAIEPMATKKSVQRLQIEAILQEYLQSEGAISCSTRIKSQLKRDIVDFTGPARYLSRVLTESPALSELKSLRYEEAALAAVSELPEA